jgi:histidine triad (HIT) family protein
MEDCIFCKIIKGEVPSRRVYEDSEFLAFLDVQPVSNGHILIIPKKHVIWMQEADDETIAKIFQTGKKLMIAAKKATKCDFVQVAVAGEQVPHFHVHLIPRYMDDSLPNFPTKQYKDGEADEMAAKISASI